MARSYAASVVPWTVFFVTTISFMSLRLLDAAFVISRQHHHYFPGQTTSSLLLAEGPRAEGVGPRGESSRMPRRTSHRRRQAPSSSSSPAVATKRAPHQFDHTKEEARPFVDAFTEIQTQSINEDAPLYSFKDEQESSQSGDPIAHNHVEIYSLDDLFPGLDFSKVFSTNSDFRNGVRDAIREDVFNTTPTYANLSEKAKKMLLLPDSSLQGSWRCHGGAWVGSEQSDDSGDTTELRMKALTDILKHHLGDGAPTGDEFMDTIGALCGSSPQTHFIDIVGVAGRRIPHSWHQDTGRCPNGDTKTVLLGFPAVDAYDGVGVFSHVVKLEKEQWATEEHPPYEPVLYTNEIEERYIMRPRFATGREIIVYRDVDVLHSAPDVTYRTSVMRFM